MAKLLFAVCILLGVLALVGAQDAKSYLTHAFDMKCNVCQITANALGAMKTSSLSAKAILTSECEKLEVGADLCLSKLVPHAADIMTRLATSAPLEVCHQISWCVANRDYFTVGPHEIPENLPAVHPEAALIDLKCAGCQGLFTYLYAKLGNKLNASQLQSKLQGMCDKAPIIVKGLCNQVIGGKLAQIVPIFDSKDPRTMCQALKMCSASMKRVEEDDDFDVVMDDESVDAEDDEDVLYDEDDDDTESDVEDVDEEVVDVETDNEDFDVTAILKRGVEEDDEDYFIDEDEEDSEDVDENAEYDMDYVEGDFDDVYDESDSDVDALLNAEDDDVDHALMDAFDEEVNADLDSDSDSDADSESDSEVDLDLPEAVLKRGVDEDDTDTDANFDDVDDEDVDEDLDEEDVDEYDEVEDVDEEDVEDAEDEDDDFDLEDFNEDDEDVDSEFDEDFDDEDVDDEDFDDEDDEDEDVDDDVNVASLENDFFIDNEDSDNDVGISMKRIVDPVHEDARVFYYGLDGKKLPIKPFNSVDTGDAECQICQWAVSAVEAYISQQDTEQELARVLQELCTVLPGNYATICQNFVVVYMDEAVNYVIDNLTPPLVCSKINICQAPPNTQTPSA